MRLLLALLLLSAAAQAQPARRVDGYRGVWYANQPQPDSFRYKYSGGFATYPQQHVPIAVYDSAAHRTFFVFGGQGEGNELLNLVSYYDHATGLVPRPAVVLARRTNDAHYNPTLSIDDRGYLYVFCNAHGPGLELSADDTTRGRAYLYRSTEPYAIDRFTLVRTDSFSYSQPWNVEGQGLLWLHTRYAGGQRRLFWSASADGLRWSEPALLAHIRRGDYQISWSDGRRVATAFDFHPDEGGLNARTNLYYLETSDLGRTWRTARGDTLSPPLTAVDNPALVHDYRAEGLLVYLKDLAFDREGRPVLLYLTSGGYRPGPESGPRFWWTARWNGASWERRRIAEADHNYDHGSLYVEPDGRWHLVAPTAPGPQPHATGGDVELWISDDEGRSWIRSARLTGGPFNHGYVRRPYRAHEDFYALWADGNPFEPSSSHLYFTDRIGRVVRRLPPRMPGAVRIPEIVRMILR